MSNTPEQDLIDRAGQRAKALHEGQMYGDAPYFAHVRHVAVLLAAGRFDPEMVAAGYLHDVVEDTEATVASISDEFGERVAGLVAAVTKPEGVDYFDYIDSLGGDAAILKAADALCNYVMGVDDNGKIVDARALKYARVMLKLAEKVTPEDLQAILGHSVDVDEWLREVTFEMAEAS